MVCLADPDQSPGLWNSPERARAIRTAGRLAVALRRVASDVVLTGRPGRGMGRDEAAPSLRASPGRGRAGQRGWPRHRFQIVASMGAISPSAARPTKGRGSTWRCARPAPARRHEARGGGALVPRARGRRGRHLREGPNEPARLYQRTILGYWYPHMASSRRAVAEGAWRSGTPGWASAALLADATFSSPIPQWLALVLEPGRPVQGPDSATASSPLSGPARSRAASASGGPARDGRAPTPSRAVLSAASLFHHFAGAAWLPWLPSPRGARATRACGGAASRARRGVQLLAGSERCASPGAPPARHGWPGTSSAAGPRSRILVLGVAGDRGRARASPRRRAVASHGGARRDSYRAVLDPARTPTVAAPRGARRPPGATPRDDLPLSEPARQRSSRAASAPRVPLRRPRAPRPRSARPRAAPAPRGGAGCGALFLSGPHSAGTPPSTPCSWACRPRAHALPAEVPLAGGAVRGGPGGGRDRGWVGRWSAAARRRGRLVAVLLLVTAGAALLAAWWVAGPPDGLAPYLAPGGDEAAAAVGPRPSSSREARCCSWSSHCWRGDGRPGSRPPPALRRRSSARRGRSRAIGQA